MALHRVPTIWVEGDGARPGVAIGQEGVSRGKSRFPRFLVVNGRPEAGEVWKRYLRRPTPLRCQPVGPADLGVMQEEGGYLGQERGVSRNLLL